MRSVILLSAVTALLIGFSFFKAENSQQGLQNQMFSVFMLFIIFNNMVQQIHPQFVAQRALYEARERPSKAYSWQAFILAQITIEFPWQILTAVITFFCWYYPIGLYRNAIPTDAVGERGFLMFLFVLSFFLFTSTFAHMTVAGSETAEAGSNLAVLCFSLCLLFCGVLATSSQLGWWIWFNRVSPFTWLVSGMLATAVAGTNVVCSDIEYLIVDPPAGETCSQYLTTFVTGAGSTLFNPNATSQCKVCLLSTTDQFLAAVDIDFKDRWRNFGFMWVYIVFNICGAILIYYLVRVPKASAAKEVQTTSPVDVPQTQLEGSSDEKA
ncbi:ABC-2 type transporter-domain-containing protein [Amylostereum chailletii]|nr:ABC-2 type transporter-domain-containing protein [Amylostereum chailletii]